MKNILYFIFLIFAAFLGKKEGLRTINSPPPPRFFTTKCKIVLLLSAFAFAPSVLANNIPLVTLQAENIQVRAEWEMVDDDGNHFSVEGGTLVLTSNISAAGKPDGITIIATVELRDQFSTLNQNYKDLATTVMITTVIMGCRAEWTINFAENEENLVVIESGSIIKVGDVIARRYTENEYNHIFLHTVSNVTMSYIETEPELLGYLDSEYQPLAVNESEDCFAEEVKTFQEQDQTYQEEQQTLQENIEYLNIHAPFISGLYAGLGRKVSVDTALKSGGKQRFTLGDVKLANILWELYTPKVIIDDGKVFSDITRFPRGGNSFVANLDGNDGVTIAIAHEVIVLDHDCPPIYQVAAVWQTGDALTISASDYEEVKMKEYVVIEGTVYTGIEINYISNSYRLHVEDTDFGSGFNVGASYLIKFSDHFLCDTEIKQDEGQLVNLIPQRLQIGRQWSG